MKNTNLIPLVEFVPFKLLRKIAHSVEIENTSFWIASINFQFQVIDIRMNVNCIYSTVVCVFDWVRGENLNYVEGEKCDCWFIESFMNMYKCAADTYTHTTMVHTHTHTHSQFYINVQIEIDSYANRCFPSILTLSRLIHNSSSEIDWCWKLFQFAFIHRFTETHKSILFCQLVYCLSSFYLKLN